MEVVDIESIITVLTDTEFLNFLTTLCNDITYIVIACVAVNSNKDVSVNVVNSASIMVNCHDSIRHR